MTVAAMRSRLLPDGQSVPKRTITGQGCTKAAADQLTAVEKETVGLFGG